MNTLRSRPRTLGLVGIAALSIAATSFVPAPGVTYRLRSVTTPPDIPGMASQGPSIMVGHGASTGSMHRFEFDSVTGLATNAFTPGDYMLVLDSGKIISVNPSSKTYTEGMPGMSGIPTDILSQASVTNVSVNVEKLGPSDTIMGYPTQKYRITNQYTMGIMGQSFNTVGTQDVWIAQLPTNINSPLTGGTVPKELSTGPMVELGNKIMEAWKSIGPGSTLKMVLNQTINGPMTISTGQTMDLMDLKMGDVDPALFRIPEGFTKKP